MGHVKKRFLYLTYYSNGRPIELKNLELFQLTHFCIYFLGREIIIPLNTKGKAKVGNYYPIAIYRIIL